MFGLGFGEIFLLLIIGLVVVGPRNLPTLMRTAGRWVSKMKRMSVDLRAQSGIDEIIRDENLEKDIQELRSLSRMNIVDTLVKPALAATAATPRPAPRAAESTATTASPSTPMLPSPSRPSHNLPGREPVREREYPPIGCDAYGALPDDVAPYQLPTEPKTPPKRATETLDAAPAPSATEAATPAAEAPARDASPEAPKLEVAPVATSTSTAEAPHA